MGRKSIMKIVNRVVFPLLFLFVATTLTLSSVVCAVRFTHPSDNTVEVEEPEPHILSPFDKMFREVGDLHKVDWCLLSAIARVESEFNPRAVSRSGATGIMQVMPHVASSMGIHRDSLFNPRVCTTVAAQLLHENYKMLNMGRDIDSLEQLKFTLACYNAGYLRVSDARRLARFYQDKSDEWYTVSGYLELLAEEEYSSHEVVKGGAYHGSKETIAYVNKVMRTYKNYCRKVARHNLSAISTNKK